MQNLISYILVIIILTGCSNSKIRYSSKQKIKQNSEQDSKTEFNTESNLIDNERNDDQSLAKADSILDNLKTLHIKEQDGLIIHTKQHSSPNSIQDVKSDLKSLKKLRKELKYPGDKKARNTMTSGLILLSVGLVLEALFILLLFGSESLLTGASSPGDALGAILLSLLSVIGVLAGIAFIIIGSVIIHKSKRKTYPR